MNTITFSHGVIMRGSNLHIIKDGLSIDPIDDKPELYELYGIKSIIPDQKQKAPTDIQVQFTKYLQINGEYVWDKKHSAASAGVVLRRKFDGDFWFFGLEGEIMHNPEGLLITWDSENSGKIHRLK